MNGGKGLDQSRRFDQRALRKRRRQGLVREQKLLTEDQINQLMDVKALTGQQ